MKQTQRRIKPACSHAGVHTPVGVFDSVPQVRAWRTPPWSTGHPTALALHDKPAVAASCSFRVSAVYTKQAYAHSLLYLLWLFDPYIDVIHDDVGVYRAIVLAAYKNQGTTGYVNSACR